MDMNAILFRDVQQSVVKQPLNDSLVKSSFVSFKLFWYSTGM